MRRIILLLITATLTALLPAHAQEPEKVTVKFSVAANGTITEASYYNPGSWDANTFNSGDQVPKGCSIFVSAKPDDGYEKDYISVNGDNNSSGDFIYTTVEVDTEIVFHFKKTPPTYTVNFAGSENGSLGAQYVHVDKDGKSWDYAFDPGKGLPEGTVLKFTATPMPNYVVDKWTKDGVEVSPSAEDPYFYTTTVGTTETTIKVTFKEGKSGSPLTFSAGPGGKITTAYIWMPIGQVKLNSGDHLKNGQMVEFNAKADEGYEFDHWILNGEKQPQNSYYFNTNINGPTDVQMTFKRKGAAEYPVTFAANEGATLTASYTDASGATVNLTSGSNVPTDTSVKFSLAINEGYELERWYINDVVEASLAGQTEFSRTISDALSVRAQVKKKEAADGKLTINFVAKENGTIAQAWWYDKDMMNHELTSGMKLDKDTPYFIEPRANEGYAFDYWLINGVKDETRILDRTITENLTLEAYFKSTEVKYNVTLTTDYNGTLQGEFFELGPDGNKWRSLFDGKKQILAGTEVTVKATPQPNYTVDKWTVNGSVVTMPADSPNVYKFTVAGETTIHVTFKQGDSGHPVTFSAGEGGSITQAIVYTGTGPIPLNNGDKLADGVEIELTASPDNGYEIDQWLINGTADTRYNGVTTYKGAVSGAMEIKVTFKAVAPTDFPVTFLADEGGTVLATYKDAEGKDVYPQSGDKIKKGTSVKFWINIKEGYELAGWQINGTAREDLKGKTEFTLTIEGETSIKAQLKKPDSADAIAAAGLRFFIADEVLFVEGTTAPVEIALYDSRGVRLFTGKVAGRLDVSFLSSGIYFVVAEGETVKVLK